MKILQINTWMLRLPAGVADTIERERPSIVAMQEVLDAKFDIGFLPSLREFAERVNFPYSYFSPVYGITYMEDALYFGNATMSKFPLHDGVTVFTNLEYKDNYHAGKDDYNVRNFQHIIAEDEHGTRFHLINHHGYHVPEHKNGTERTLRACQQILDYTSQLTGPIIITGDFNLSPQSESLAVLNDRFRNLSIEFGLTTTRNQLTHKKEVCDYIFVNDKVIVNDFYASDVIASDHKGLVLDFKL